MGRLDVLVLTADEDHAASLVMPLLRRRGLTTERWDPGTVPSIALAGAMLKPPRWTSVELSAGRLGVRLDEVRTVWLRRPSAPRSSAGNDLSLRAFIESETLWFLTSLWALVPAAWVNPIQTGRRASDKAVQLTTAMGLGLSVPATYIGNDPTRVREMFDACDGRLIVKPFVAGAVSRPEGPRRLLYTAPVRADDLQDDAGIRDVPAIWQQAIPKALELRVTVVGDEVLSGAIYSQDSPRTQHDWRRYDFQRVRHEAHNLDAEIQDHCRELVRKLGLRFGAIDLIVTPDGEHYFLEVNPFGEWLWMEQRCRLPIADAHADLFDELCRGEAVDSI